MKGITNSIILSVLMSLFVWQNTKGQTSTIEWVKILGTTDDSYKHDNGICINAAATLSKNGSLYSVGHFRDTLDFDPNSSQYNLATFDRTQSIFITKLSANGDLIWAKSLNCTGQSRAFAIEIDDFNNVYVTGKFQDSLDVNPSSNKDNFITQGNGNNFIAKFDSNGEFIWSKQFTGKVGKILLHIDNLNKIWFIGNFTDTIDFNIGETGYLMTQGSNDVFISKLDQNGDYLFMKQFGGEYSDIISSIALDDLGNICLFGKFKGEVDFDPSDAIHKKVAEGEGIFISKLDSEANLIWVKTLNSNPYIWLADISVDGLGNIYTSGSFKLIIDLDPSDAVYNLYNYYPTCYPDAFISKLNASGDFVWAKQFKGGYNLATIESMDVDKKGNIYTMGSFFNDIDFDPNFYTEHLVRGELHGSMFICRLNANGTLSWVKHIAGLYSYGHTQGSGDPIIKVDNFGNVYASGWLLGSGYFGVDEQPSFDMDSHRGERQEMFNLKISQEGLADLPEYTLSKDFVVSQNPSNNYVDVYLDHFNRGSISIVDLNGKILHKLNLEGGLHIYTFPLENYPSGVYLIDVILDGKEMKSKKIIVQ